MQKSSVLVILIAFILGIIIADTIAIHWILGFTVWITCLFSFIILNTFKRTHFLYRKWLSWSLVVIFFFSGVLGYQLKQPTSFESEFSNIYLSGEYVIGEVIEFQKGKNEYDKVILKVEKIVKHGKQIEAQGKLLCYFQKSEKEPSIGNILLFQPNLSPIKNKGNPGEFNMERYWRLKGIQYISFIPDGRFEIIDHRTTFFQFFQKSRNKLIQIIEQRISTENQGLVIALSLGDKSNLSMESRDQFANAGAMHVLAVSGMHIGILLAFLQFLFKRIRFLRNRNLSLIFALVFLWFFALLTGLPASVSRAVTMFSILAIGQLLGKRFFSLNAIFTSALILLFFNPLLLYDIGFQLSYLAVISIALFYRPISNLFVSRFKAVNWIWEGTAISIAAQIGTVPISLYYFNQFPNYFMLSNLGIILMAAIALNAVVIFLVLHFIPYVSDFLAYAVDFIFTVLGGFIAWINTLPAVVSTGYTPPLVLLILIYIGIGFALYHWNKHRLPLFNVGISTLFICSILLVVDRELNKGKEELIILNHNKKVVLWKSNQTLYTIFDARDQEKLNLDFLLSGYEKSVGVQSERIALPLNAEVCLGDEICFENKSEGVLITYHKENLLLANKTDGTSHTPYKIIKGNWNPYLEIGEDHYNVVDKALVFKKSFYK